MYSERGIGSGESQTHEFGIKEPLECEKNPPQDLSDPNSPGKELDQSCVLLVAGNCCATLTRTQQCIFKRGNKVTRSSRTKKLEYSADLRGQPAPGNWAREGKIINSEGRSFTPKICRSFDYRYLEKVFENLQKKLYLAEDAPSIGIKSLKINVLIWWLMSTTMKAAIHMGKITMIFGKSPGTRTSKNSRVYSMSPRSWCCIIKWRFWMWKRLNGHLLHDQIYTFSWSSDQMDESKSTRIFRFRLMIGKMSGHSEAYRRWEGQVK